MRPRSIVTIGPSTLLPLRGLRRMCLLTVIVLVGCAPTVAPAPAQPDAPVQPAPTENEPPTVPSPTPTVVQPQVVPTEALPTEAPAETPQVVATSRGPNLEATDPETVSLNSGNLQFVEFFRFT